MISTGIPIACYRAKLAIFRIERNFLYRAVSHFYVLNLHVAEACGMVVCMSSGAQSERFLQLNVEDKKCYMAKLSLIDGLTHTSCLTWTFPKTWLTFHYCGKRL